MANPTPTPIVNTFANLAATTERTGVPDVVLVTPSATSLDKGRDGAVGEVRSRRRLHGRVPGGTVVMSRANLGTRTDIEIVAFDEDMLLTRSST